MSFLVHMIGDGLQRILDQPAAFAETAGRTLLLATASAAAAAVVGVPLGAALGLRRGRLAVLLAAAANAGLGIPAVVLGAYLALLMLPGSPLGEFGLTNTLSGLLLAQWLLAVPIVVALAAAAVSALPVGVTEQARAFGAGRGDLILLAASECRRPVGTAVFAAFGSALAEVGAVVIVGGNVRGSTNTLASTVLLDLASGDPAGATANVILLLVIIAAAGAVFTRLQRVRAESPA